MALVPALLILTVAAWQMLMAGWALVSAQAAARSAARAELAGAPLRTAALAALPDGMRSGATVRLAAGNVTVRVHIPSVLPGFAADVTASAPAVRQ
jgi:hypothetical protein